MDSTSTIFLIGALFIIMIGMGLSLTFDDFRRILKYPKAVFLGFLNQIILLPIIGYVLIVVFNLDTTIAMGIMILAACPGGATSNLVTHIAKGDTALSVTLTAVNSIITIFTIPLIVNFGLSQFMTGANTIEAPVGKIIGSLFVVIAIPLTIGMLIKRFSNQFAGRMDKPVRIASAIVLVLVIVGIMIKEKENLISFFEQALLYTFLLNATTMLIGYVSSRVSNLDFRQSLTISIESGSQNGTLAIHVAVVSLASSELAIVAAVYSLVMYATAIVPVWIGNRRGRV